LCGAAQKFFGLAIEIYSIATISLSIGTKKGPKKMEKIMNNAAGSIERGRGWDVLGSYDNLMGGWLKPVNTHHDMARKVPSIDVSENEGAFLVQAELPGVGREGIEVTVTDGILKIVAERKARQSDDKTGRSILKEQFFGKLSRSLKLGSGIDDSKIEARYEDGVLNLWLPKVAEAQPRKVDIKVG